MTLARDGLSILIPAFNERGRLPLSLPRLLEIIDPATTELIIISAGRPDGPSDVARQLLRRRARSSAIRLPFNQGKGAAIRAGVAAARGATIAYMDADLAADLADLPRLIDALSTVHIAAGSRAVAGSVTSGATRTRTYMGRTFNQMARWATGVNIMDFQCPLKAMRSATARLLFYLGQVNGYAFEVEILALAHRLGFSMAEVPIRVAAMPGSHIRPVVDPIKMTVDLCRIRRQHSQPRLISSVEAFTDDDLVPHPSAVAALSSRFSSVGPIFGQPHRAMALLPFVDPISAHRVAYSLQQELPYLRVRSVLVPVSDLLGPRMNQAQWRLAAS